MEDAGGVRESAGSPERGYGAIVLAGRRSPEDPLAAATGARHRALLPIAGEPMLARVLRVLRETPAIGPVLVSIDDRASLEATPEIAALLRASGPPIVVLDSESSPARSVLAALDALPGEQPILITTADHALLSREMVEHFLARAEATGGDMAVALVAATQLKRRFPDAVRTYLPFRGERYSGANLFALMTPRARRAVEFWQRAERHRKRPWRLVGSFGICSLALFLARRLDLAEAFGRASRILDARVHPVEMPWAEAAVDVDKLSDFELVNEILAEAEAAEAAANQIASSPAASNTPVVSS